jgi:hypothetical protein
MAYTVMGLVSLSETLIDRVCGGKNTKKYGELFFPATCYEHNYNRGKQNR